MENELIKITTNEEGKKLVSARELHEFLEIKSVFSTWFNRMKEYGFETNIDFIEIWSDSKNGNAVEYLGSPQKMSAKGYEVDYAISIDMAKELSMIQRTDKGKQARKYFIECEKQLKQTQQPQLPQTYLEALKSLVASEEERLRLEEEKKELENKNKEQEETIFLITNHSTTIEESRKVINALVRRISPCICKPYGQTWGELYTKFNYMQGININGRTKVKGEKSKLDRLTEVELYKLEEVVRNWATELNIDIKEVLKLTSKEEE